MLARACGKSDVHDLEPEDLRALTLEASFITGIPVVGTSMVFGRPDLYPLHSSHVVAEEQHSNNHNSKSNGKKHAKKKHKKHSDVM